MGRVAETVRKAIGARAVSFSYVETDDTLMCGDPCPWPDGELGRNASVLVREEILSRGTAVAFRIQNNEVLDFAPAAEARGRPYLAFLPPGRDTLTERLIAYGSWRGGKAAAAVEFVQAAMPALTVLLDRLVNAERATRQQWQLSALADVAQALIESQDLEVALRDMATALAAVSGFDFVTVYLWDPNSERRVLVVPSESRYSASDLVELWRALAMKHYHAIAEEAIRTGLPMLHPDLQHDEHFPEEMHAYFERTSLHSSAMLPLLFKDEALGTISFTSFKTQAFSPEDVEFLRGLAAQVAMALKGLRLYHDLAESREHLRQYTERLQASMEIQHQLARTDALTGIPNRRYLDEIVQAECARATRQSTTLSLAMADLDYFKLVNDTYGHPAGDEVLIAVSQLARRTCREMDVVGRYGGDEFLFVLPGASLEDAGAFAERFRQRVGEVCFSPCPDAEIRLTISLGTSGGNGTHLDRPAELLERADRALYQAKTGGRNRTCLYLPDGRLSWAA
jgi:diguanylate cyclase (GGDEF)-like protein